MNNDTKIRDWLMSFPETPEANSPHSVLKIARDRFIDATGSEIELGEFTDSMWRIGMRPESVGSRWVIRFPTRPLADDSHFRRLRNLVG